MFEETYGADCVASAYAYVAIDVLGNEASADCSTRVICYEFMDGDLLAVNRVAILQHSSDGPKVACGAHHALLHQEGVSC